VEGDGAAVRVDDGEVFRSLDELARAPFHAEARRQEHGEAHHERGSRLRVPDEADHFGAAGCRHEFKGSRIAEAIEIE
jgi:hypothetical protein